MFWSLKLFLWGLQEKPWLNCVWSCRVWTMLFHGGVWSLEKVETDWTTSLSSHPGHFHSAGSSGFSFDFQKEAPTEAEEIVSGRHSIEIQPIRATQHSTNTKLVSTKDPEQCGAIGTLVDNCCWFHSINLFIQALMANLQPSWLFWLVSLGRPPPASLQLVWYALYRWNGCEWQPVEWLRMARLGNISLNTSYWVSFILLSVVHVIYGAATTCSRLQTRNCVPVFTFVNDQMVPYF